MTKSKEILISLLTYNSANTIENCLNSLKNQTNQNFKCFIFDNKSSDNLHEIIKNYPEVNFVQIGKNEGYTGGHNFAINYFRKNYPNHKYMMILNPDTVLSKNLIQEFESLFKHEATLYTCVMKKSLRDKRLWTNSKIHLPSFTFLGRYIKNSEHQKGLIFTSFVMGSCFVVNLEKYLNKNLFKKYFMYHEEVELSLRLRLQGKKILSTTKGYILHIPKKQTELNQKTVYLLELNRLKLQSDLFSDFFTLLNLPFYLISRVIILVIFKPMSHAEEYSRGIRDGLKYLQKNTKSKKAGFFKTLKFLFFKNF